MTVAESQAISIETSNGQILIDNLDQYSFHGQTWTVLVDAKNLRSTTENKSASIQFTVEWKDPCYDSELLPAFITDSPTTIDLFSTMTIVYSSMLDMSGNDCGGFTNSFKYISGPAFDDQETSGANLSQLVFREESQDEFVMEGEITNPLWIGTHSF